MATNLKRVMALVLVAVICCAFLCACGISEEEAVGTWTGSYTYNGNDFSVAFVLSADGTYSEATIKNGSLNGTEKGTWEVDGGKVVLHPNGDTGHSVTYKYKDGALVNNGHEFTKK